MDELTNIEVIVFETDDGAEIDMVVVDEFEYDGRNYIALVESIADEHIVSETFDVDETIVFCEVQTGAAGEIFDTVEDRGLIAALEDILERRLLERI